MQLAQIIPMVDEDGDDGPAIVKAKVCDPYLVLLRVDGSVNVYKLDKNMELAEQDVEPLKVAIHSSERYIRLYAYDQHTGGQICFGQHIPSSQRPVHTAAAYDAETRRRRL
jgi:hypothetical protein